MKNTEPPSQRHRGIYLLPNLFTTVTLFAGFYAIVAAMTGSFGLAAVAIFVAMVADGLDGRVARLTNTQSAFGKEYDSLADMVSFGVAPALVMYSWSLTFLGKIGWLVAFCYTAAAALRLARFNVQQNPDLKFFRGLPSPAAAGIVVGFVWMVHDFEVNPAQYVSILSAIITVCAAVFMVSNLRFTSFKDIDLKGRVPFSVLLAIVLFLVFISLDPPTLLFACFALYGLSGPVLWLYRWWQCRLLKKGKD